MFEVVVKEDYSSKIEVPDGTTFTVYGTKEILGEIYYLVYYYRSFIYLKAENFEPVRDMTYDDIWNPGGAYDIKRGVPTELADTASMMTSDDYKERFKAEYYQLKIRMERLEATLKQLDDKKFYESVCPRKVLEGQMKAMQWYMTVLETRASLEKINLMEM